MMLFTRDLRLTDNPALSAAAAAAELVPAFVLDDALLAGPAVSASRLSFLHDALRDLDGGLRDAGGALVMRRGAWVDTVIRTAREGGVETIHVADDVSGVLVDSREPASYARAMQDAIRATRVYATGHTQDAAIQHPEAMDDEPAPESRHPTMPLGSLSLDSVAEGSSRKK